MTDCFIVWSVDPEIFRIGSFSLRYYGLLFALGFFVGYYIVRYFYKKENAPLEEVDKMAMYIILGSVIGARLGHCLFYEPDYFLANPIEILLACGCSHGRNRFIFGLLAISRKSHCKSCASHR